MIKSREITVTLVTIMTTSRNALRKQNLSPKRSRFLAGNQLDCQHLKSLLKTEVQEVRRGLELTFSTDQAALDRLCRRQLGKTILFTDNADWSDEEIVLAYRSQYHIEEAFKQMKD